MVNQTTTKTEIAVTKNGEDYIRIIPKLKGGNQLELIFMFQCQDFIIRDYTIEQQQDFTIQTVHHDRRLNSGQITYHGKNESGMPVVHQKKKTDIEGEKKYETITRNVLNLDFSHIICPLPVCRITINKPSGVNYEAKSKHLQFEDTLTDEANSLDIFVAPLNYDANTQMNLWPHIMNQSVISTIDAAIVGSARSFQHIYSKMRTSENSAVITSKGAYLKNACLAIGKTYRIDKQVNPIYQDTIYDKENIIEFFDTRDYLQCIAVNVCSNELNSPQKLIYRLDLWHQLIGGMLEKEEWNYWREFFEEGLERFFPSNTFPKKPDKYYEQLMSNLTPVKDEDAKLRFALMCEESEIPDYVHASKYYKEMADKGNGIACFRLARIMAKGRSYNIEWNIEMAIDYLEKAANQGVLEAGLSLLALYRDGVWDRGLIKFRNWAKYHALLLSLYHVKYLPVMLELYHGVNLGIYGFPKNKDLADIVLQKILSTKLNANKLVKDEELCIFQEQFDVYEKQTTTMEIFISFARRRYVIEKCPDLVIGIGKYPW